jgi:hypothetical protein
MSVSAEDWLGFSREDRAAQSQRRADEARAGACSRAPRGAHAITFK